MIDQAKRMLVGTTIQPFIMRYVRRPLGRIKVLSKLEQAGPIYEDEIADECRAKLIERDTNCLDIGCHIGSVLADMRRAAPDGRHVAVEATPDKASYLAKKFPGVTILPYAAGDEEGEVTFYVHERRSGYNGLSASGDGAKELVVPMRRLDDTLPAGFDPGFVKIDVEGAELQALRGLESTLRRARPIILFECGVARPMDDGGFEGDALFAYLTEELDYDIFGPVDLKFGRPPLTLGEFRRRRTYPFAGWNSFAVPKDRRGIAFA